MPVKCPDCGVETYRIFLTGKQALCINRKCPIDKFTVQAFEKKFKEGKIKNDKKNKKESKSHVNSRR